MFSLARGRLLASHVLPAVIRPARVVWNQIIGFLFLVLALWASPAMIRSIREFNGDLGSVYKVVLPSIFVLLMAGFGIGSFRRAWKINRQ